MEVFITRSNAERIINKMDVKALDITEFAEQMQFKWFNNGELGTLKAYEFPFINLLWLGVIIMTFGFGVATWSRVSKLKEK